MIKGKFLIAIFVLLVLSLNFVSASWFSPPRPSPPYSNHPGFIPNNFNHPRLEPFYPSHLDFIYNDFNPPYHFHPPSPRLDHFYPHPPRLGPGYIRNFW